MSQDSSSYVGQVKWFNNRLGYGFITIISECESKNQDIFVHQQHITPKTSDYRALQQGEYVSFQLGTADSNTEGESVKHDNQAVNVTGVFGGTLMCDHNVRQHQSTGKPTESSESSAQKDGFTSQSGPGQRRTSGGPPRTTRTPGTTGSGFSGRGRGTGRPRQGTA
jgi:cold shock CspA family protein